MSSFKLSYLAWPAMIGICGAWAFSGFMFTGTGPQTGFSDAVQAVRSQPDKPDFNVIDNKNIFKADMSAVSFKPDAAQTTTPQDAAAQAEQPILLGIVKGRYTSYAVVSSGGENIILKLGIPKNGMVLKKVHHDSVDVLTETGSLMTLKFVETKDDDDSQTQNATQPAQQTAPQPADQTQPADQPATGQPTAGQNASPSAPPQQTAPTVKTDDQQADDQPEQSDTNSHPFRKAASQKNNQMQ